jgi:hypothetical protein
LLPSGKHLAALAQVNHDDRDQARAHDGSGKSSIRNMAGFTFRLEGRIRPAYPICSRKGQGKWAIRYRYRSHAITCQTNPMMIAQRSKPAGSSLIQFSPFRAGTDSG